MNASQGTIRIHQTQSYVCCANITMRLAESQTTLVLYEDNVGGMCRCICPFEADITIWNATGYDRIEVYGIRYRDASEYELLFNSSLSE